MLIRGSCNSIPNRYTFDLHMKGQKNIAIIITSGKSRIRHGIFIGGEITDISTEHEMKGIVDKSSFVFTFKDENSPVKYSMRQSKQQYQTVFIYDNTHENILSIGRNDIVLKKDSSEYCINNDVCYYDYGKTQHALTGKDSDVSKNEGKITAHRIVVLQFE